MKRGTFSDRSARVVPAAARAGGEAAPICVRNEDTDTYFFAVEANGAGRRTAVLAPGETLCTEAAPGQKGVVWVFENEDSIEGCSRLVSAGQTEAMLRWSEFDRCAWSSNS